MKFTKGTPKPPNSGRKKGQVNKANETAQTIMQRFGVEPVEGMAMIALGEVPCGTCHGTGVTGFRLRSGHHAVGCDGKENKQGLCACEGIGERKCLSCYGSLLENITPDLRGKMYAELAKYRHPQLKAVEMSGSLGLTTEIEERLRLGRLRARGE